MPSDPTESVQVEYTPEFKRNLRTLAKKYRHIRSDVQPVIDRLQAGEAIGDQVQGTPYTIFKVRAQNSDIRKGKSSGYRLIYYLRIPTSIVLVTIYSKLDQADISAEQIRRILKEFDEQRLANTENDGGSKEPDE
jgi:mRNA-degrading endonuclease RelE of RelBE toxin-antitoxin system